MSSETIRRRIEKIEAAAGAEGTFERRLRAFAVRTGGDPDVLLRVTHGHEQDLRGAIDDGGLVTYSGLAYICDLLGAERVR
jgi:hypothetical protein